MHHLEEVISFFLPQKTPICMLGNMESIVKVSSDWQRGAVNRVKKKEVKPLEM